MKREIEEHIKASAKCQQNKIRRPNKRAPMEITTTDRHPFEKCAPDIVGPMTEKMSGNKYILTCQDNMSKFLVAMLIPQQDTETVAR